MTTIEITREHEDECITLCEVPKREKCRVGHFCWCTAIDCDGLGLPDPDDIGATEYRAIYDALNEGLESAAEDGGEYDPASTAIGMLDEVLAWASKMRKALVEGDGERG